jgi:hypothetical protein
MPLCGDGFALSYVFEPKHSYSLSARILHFDESRNILIGSTSLNLY